MTTVYLAYVRSGKKPEYTLNAHKDTTVNLLVSFTYLKDFEKYCDGFNIGKLSLDSGAFSAWRSGRVIDIQEYMSACKRWLARGACEVFGLDVIGDAWNTKQNLETMWLEKIMAIPTFHYGEKWEDLLWCTKKARELGINKIALGGMARLKDSVRIPWVLQCFARIWPFKIHGFGCSSRKILESAPLHSVDASSWEFGPFAAGTWVTLGNIRARGQQDAWVEVLEYKRREEWAKNRWATEMSLLENLE